MTMEGMMDDSVVKRCGAPTIRGQPCRREPLPGRDLCAAHHPDMMRRHREGSRRGGIGRGGGAGQLDLAGVDVATLEGLKSLLAKAIEKASQLGFTERTANAIAVLAAQLRAILQDAELERRIAALEKTVESDVQDRPPWAA